MSILGLILTIIIASYAPQVLDLPEAALGQSAKEIGQVASAVAVNSSVQSGQTSNASNNIVSSEKKASKEEKPEGRIKEPLPPIPETPKPEQPVIVPEPIPFDPPYCKPGEFYIQIFPPICVYPPLPVQ
jgi:hypothetical protein